MPDEKTKKPKTAVIPPKEKKPPVKAAPKIKSIADLRKYVADKGYK